MPHDIAAIEAMAKAYTDAWNSGSAAAVAAHFSSGGRIVINNGAPYQGRAGVEEMANGFFTGVPDLSLVCEGVRAAGPHVIYLWKFTGHDSGTGNPLAISGWEEWDLGPDLKIESSRGWYDADDYARQVEGR